jgi:hypothetical protein
MPNGAICPPDKVLVTMELHKDGRPVYLPLKHGADLHQLGARKELVGLLDKAFCLWVALLTYSELFLSWIEVNLNLTNSINSN